METAIFSAARFRLSRPTRCVKVYAYTCNIHTVPCLICSNVTPCLASFTIANVNSRHFCFVYVNQAVLCYLRALETFVDTRAALTTVPVVPWEPPPPAARGPRSITAKFYHAVLTFERTFRNHKFRGLNVTTIKKGRRLFWGRNTYHQINPGYAYEKRAPPYVGMGPKNG